MKLSVSEWISQYCKLCDYLCVSQLYLKDNFLMNSNLKNSDIKERIVGHWGTCPGINYIYASMNAAIHEKKVNVMTVLGPGHGFPALQANLFLEGSLGKVNRDYKINKNGIKNLIKNFSWPNKLPSHPNPFTPGSILEGGELGYSLSTSYGAIMDNPKLIVMCIIGDGESETGPLAASWWSNKFINPKRDGAVLPVVHINGYKISNPTIFSSMSNKELSHYFTGLNYEPIIIETNQKDDRLYKTIKYAITKIKEIQKYYKAGDKPKWPVILLKTPKGWGGIKSNNDIQIENSYSSHGVPINPKKSKNDFNALKNWLKSYKINEIINKSFIIDKKIFSYLPTNNLRMGRNKNAHSPNHKLKLNNPNKYFDKDQKSSLKLSAKYLADVLDKNKKTFRLFCPDEVESNLLGGVFEKTKRVYIWPFDKEVNQNTNETGRVLEMLSEHTLQGWLNGYIMTGRHGLFTSYESFIPIISTMADQFAKYIKVAKNVKFRNQIPSLNYLLTSLGWRQDHNGFSHQNPSFISEMFQRHSDFIKIYFPSNSIMTVHYLKKSFETKDGINIIVAGKRDMNQYLNIKETNEQIKKGGMIWKEFSDDQPNIIFSSAGDYVTQEMILAIQILKKDFKTLKMRYVNVSDLDFLKQKELSHKYYTDDKPIIFSFHGYPELIKSIFYDNPISNRMKVHGYIEEGTTTTPFDMQVKNKTSRYHIAIQALELVLKDNETLKYKAQELIKKYNLILKKHNAYILKFGKDMPEIENRSKIK